MTIQNKYLSLSFEGLYDHVYSVWKMGYEQEAVCKFQIALLKIRNYHTLATLPSPILHCLECGYDGKVWTKHSKLQDECWVFIFAEQKGRSSLGPVHS